MSRVVIAFQLSTFQFSFPRLEAIHMRVVRAFQLSESRIGKWKAEKNYPKSVVFI